MQNAKKWFLLNSGHVQGPYGSEEVEALLPGAVEPLVWGRGLPEWLPPSEWRKSAKELSLHVEKTSQHEEPHWRMRNEGKEEGPFVFNDLLTALKKFSDFSTVDISEDQKQGWKEVYAFPRIVDELGITRRAHPRVPIMGTLKVESSRGAFEARVVTISEGGIGVNDVPPFPIGEKFRGMLSSPNLFQQIPCTCEVVYVGGDGYTGLRFTQIPMEAQAALIEYVRKFQDSKSPG